MSHHMYPPKPKPGDRVAALSPSSGLPGILPLPFELGLERLRADFELVPVEYPTTRKMGASAAERAADIHAAFADDSIKAVISSIGGDDQLTVLPHLDAELLRANPKPFFGYSDNSCLHAYLYQLGIVSYYGGAMMTEFGREGAMHPLTTESLRAALFGSGEYRLSAAESFTDVNRPWEDPATFETEPELMPAHGWIWHKPGGVVTGTAWGGCPEVLAGLLMADRAIPTPEELTGAVLYFETSEEMPDDEYVFRFLRALGERGVLGRAGALLMARPKGWSFDNRFDDEQRTAFAAAQRAAVLRAAEQYAPDLPIVFDIDCGHTDPKVVIPNGGMVTVDGDAREITVRY